MLVQEFSETCLAAREGREIHGYLVGFPKPEGTGYIHLVAVRDDARGTGLGRRLYGAFSETVGKFGAVRLKAITSVTNTGSIAFHRALGFDATVVDDYSGSGEPRVVFSRGLHTR